MQHLDSNPEVYKEIMKKKRKQESEDAGLMAFLKVCGGSYEESTISICRRSNMYMSVGTHATLFLNVCVCVCHTGEAVVSGWRRSSGYVGISSRTDA